MSSMEDMRTELTAGTAVGALPGGANGPSFDPVNAPVGSAEAVGVEVPELPPDPTESMVPKQSDDEDETRPLSLPGSEVTIERLGDKRLLELAIESAPDPEFPGRHLPSTRFAETIALCNDRTLRRYEAGERGLPNLLREKLQKRLAIAQKVGEDQAPDSPLAAWKAMQRALTKAGL